MSSPLLSVVNQLYPISPSLEAAITASLRRQTLPRKTRLLQTGKVCNHLYFIEQGLVRAFYSRDGQDVTAWFMQENDLIISVYSFYTRQPSYENVELLEESTLVSIDYAQLQQLYRTFPEFNFVGRVLTERYYVLSEERTLSLRLQTALERYHDLLKSNPLLFGRAPLKQIASYLGMTPETLSRLRARRD